MKIHLSRNIFVQAGTEWPTRPFGLDPTKPFSRTLPPFDDSIVYVCIEGRWHVAKSTALNLHRAMDERSLLFESSQARDLSALRAELSDEMNRAAARIVNDTLKAIAKRPISKRPAAKSSNDKHEDAGAASTAQMFSYDDIEPYENEDG